ncbi:MAG TPA: rhodanese-like domain-containing protein [Methylomirabilota bacterium]|nr:rhodanese-like domain-containing protein [Methylomirabilota bacterium]
MIFQQLVNEDSGCLSYLIGCGEAGQAIVVDPGRDRVSEYLRLARKKGLRIAHVLETHTHADHISGNRDLAAATRAAIHVHASAGVAFEHEALRDGSTVRVGNVEVRVAHTPGHTPDSICLFVTDHARSDAPWFVLTGDLLFVGSVGRPDLGGATAAEDIWESLRRVLLPLDDSVEIYPAHGAGSSCGKAMSAKSGSTIGFERRFNPAFRYDDRRAFVDFIMAGLPPKPAAFDKIVAKNKGLVALAAAKPRPYSAREAREAVAQGAFVLDLREVADFGDGHVPGAVNVWIDGPQFAERVAGLAPAGAPVLLMGAPSDVDRAVAALARVGVDDVVGFLQWGMVEWRSEGFPVETVPQITVHDLAAWLEQGRDVVVIDVREPSEWDEGHIEGALHLPMFEAVERRSEVPDDRAKAVVCAGGLRSSAVISVLQRHGLGGFHNVTGGMAAWAKAGYGFTRQRPAPPSAITEPAAGTRLVVDCRGLSCPWPSMKVSKAITEVEPGGVLEVLATDPGAPGDLEAFARRTGHRIVEQSQSGVVLRFLVQRAQ